MNDLNKDSKGVAAESAALKSGKRKSPFVRVIIMVVLLCVVVFAAVIVSDLATRYDDTNENVRKSDYVTIRVSGEVIYLDGESVTIEELADFYENKKAQDSDTETAFITDTLNPADSEVLSQVAELLNFYGINVDVDVILEGGALAEEVSSTKDEDIR